MRYCQLRFSIVAIDADGICVEVFEQWYPLKNTSVPGGDKWHAILWFLPLTRVYRKVSRTNVPQSMSFWRLWASGENTHTAPDALRTLNKWCITPRGYSTRSMRVLTAIPRGVSARINRRNYIWSSAKIRGNVSADTIDDYRRCQTRYSFSSSYTDKLLVHGFCTASCCQCCLRRRRFLLNARTWDCTIKIITI